MNEPGRFDDDCAKCVSQRRFSRKKCDLLRLSLVSWLCPYLVSAGEFLHIYIVVCYITMFEEQLYKLIFRNGSYGGWKVVQRSRTNCRHLEKEDGVKTRPAIRDTTTMERWRNMGRGVWDAVKRLIHWKSPNCASLRWWAAGLWGVGAGSAAGRLGPLWSARPGGLGTRLNSLQLLREPQRPCTWSPRGVPGSQLSRRSRHPGSSSSSSHCGLTYSCSPSRLALKYWTNLL